MFKTSFFFVLTSLKKKNLFPKQTKKVFFVVSGLSVWSCSKCFCRFEGLQDISTLLHELEFAKKEAEGKEMTGHSQKAYRLRKGLMFHQLSVARRGFCFCAGFQSF